MTEPIRLTVEVGCPPAVAFAVWTEGIARWWPADHTATGAEDVSVVLEGGVGGRIFERTPGGVEHDWGEVTIWEPPDRLGYLWHLRRDRSDATDVEIRFVEVDAGARSRVEIEHRGWQRLGADAETWRDRNHAGWSSLLPHYIGAAGAGDEPRGVRG